MDERNEVLALAAAVERNSTHPLAVAMNKEHLKTSKHTSVAENSFKQEPGLGAFGTVNGKKIVIGTKEFVEFSLKSSSFPPELEDAFTRSNENGSTTVCVSVDGKMAGVFEIRDKLRPNAKTTIERLQKSNKKNFEIIMLSGDRQETADTIAKSVILIPRMSTEMSVRNKKLSLSKTCKNLVNASLWLVMGSTILPHWPHQMLG